jgi:hypothetical protein
MHLSRVVSRQNGREYTAWLVRQSFREGGKVKHRTLANLSALPLVAIEAVASVLKGEPLHRASSAFVIERSLPHGHVHAVLGTVRRLGLERMVSNTPSRQRDLVVGLIVQRLLRPCSKLATSRAFESSTLPALLGIEDAGADELYAAMDWLVGRQERIEKKLAAVHLADGGLALYDLSSSSVEGRHCSLAHIGYSRDGKRGTLQIEYGLITNAVGCPVAIEVFPGNTADPATVTSQVEKLTQRFGLNDVVLVGDRGMLTAARIEELRTHGGIGWISALRSPQIHQLVDGGVLQLSLFDERNLAEITDPAYPNERLVVCKNPVLAEERSRKREDLLRATEAKLAPIVVAVETGRLKGAAEIGLRTGRVVNVHKVAKHFDLTITDDRLVVSRKQEQIAQEAALDGIYVLRTSVTEEIMDGGAVVRAYKSREHVERAFRSFKSVDLQVRPIHHWAESRVRAHLLLCMLAYYVQWHLERAWAPLLFRDEDPAPPADPVAPAQRSATALRKASTQRTTDGFPVHSFRTLLVELATLTRNRVRTEVAPDTFDVTAAPTPLQQRALALLGLATSL